MPGGQGGRRFSGFGVGRGFAIWGPFRVQASVKAPESCAWSTRSEGGGNLLGRNLDGNQIARKYRTCAGHADLLFRDGGKRQAGKCDCLLEFTSRPELFLRAVRESGHNSICQNGLKVLLRVTVRPKKRDSSAISSGVAALKSAESTPVRDCPGLLQDRNYRQYCTFGSSFALTSFNWQDCATLSLTSGLQQLQTIADQGDH